MTIFVSGGIGIDQVKMRFQEPFVSQGLNRKMFGVIPRGVYAGFVVIPSADNNPRHIDITNNQGYGCVSGYCFGAYDTTSGFSIAVHEDLFGNQTTITGQATLGQFTLDLTGLDGQSVFAALDVAYLLGQPTQGFVKIVDAAEIAANPNLTVLAKINVPSLLVPISDANIVTDDPVYPRLTPYASRFKNGLMTGDDYRTLQRHSDLLASELTSAGQISWNLSTTTVAWTSALNIRMFQRALQYQVQSGSITLNDQDIVYVVVPDVVSNTSLTVVKTTLGSFSFDEHEALHYPLFYRDGNTIYVPHGNQLLNPGDVIGLEANQDRAMKLVKGGTWSWVSGTGTLAWSADAFVDIPQVPQASNRIPAGNVVLTNDADMAVVEINRQNVGATTLAITVANSSTFTPDDNSFVIARRETNDVLVGRSFRLIGGQSKKLDAGLSNQNVSYIGLTDESSSSPAYTTAAVGSTPNAYITDGDNLTKAIKELDTRASVQANIAEQNVSMQLEAGGTWSWASGTGTLSFSADSYVVVAGIAQNRNRIPTGNMVLTADQQAAYVSVNRSSGSAATLTVTVVDIGSVPLADNTFIVAMRDGNDIIVSKGMRLVDGESKKLFAGLSDQNRAFVGATSESDNSPSYSSNNYVSNGNSLVTAVGELDTRALVQAQIADQNVSMSLEAGGTWSWTSGTGALVNSAQANVVVFGVAQNRNQIAAQTITLNADQQTAYVTVNRSGSGAATLVVSVADIGSVPLGDNVFVVAIRDGAEVIVGKAMRLISGESKKLFAGLSNQNNTFIGAKNEADSSPAYTTALGGSTPNNTVADGDALTAAIKKLDGTSGSSSSAANQDRSLKLVKGGDWSWNSGTGVLTWPSNANVQIPGLADTVNLIASGTVTLSSDGAVAYVEVNRTGPGGTLTVQTSTVLTITPDSNTFIIARRENNDVLIGGTMRLTNGESKTLYAGVSDQALAYMGSPNNATSAPTYVSTTYVTQSASLTSGIDQLDARAGVQAQISDQNVSMRVEGGGDWSWTSGTGALAISATAFVVVAGVAQNRNQISAATFTLNADQQAAYVSVNRSGGSPATLAVTVTDISTVPNTDNVFVIAIRDGNDVVIDKGMRLINGESKKLFAGVSDQMLGYIGSPSNATSLPAYTTALGGSIPNRFVSDGDSLTKAVKELDGDLGLFGVDYACQDRNAKLVRGGTWAWSMTSGLLSFTQTANIQIPGIPESANQIQTGMSPIFLSQDGVIAYVNLNRTALPQNLSIVTGLASGVSCASGIYVIARRIGSDVMVGNQSSHLIDGESTELDQGLSVQTRALLGSSVTPATSAPNYSGRGSPQRTIDNSQGILDALASADNQIDKFFGQIRIESGSTVSKVAITGVDFTMKDNSILSQQMNDFILNFTGAVIDFSTGNVFASDGITALGLNFTPLTIPTGNYAWYSLTLIPGTVGADNRLSAQFEVLAAASTGTTPTNAPYPQFVSSGKQTGAVLVQNLGGTVTVTQIRQLGFGSGSGSGGDPSFQIATVSGNNARITGGRLLRDDGFSYVTGSGTTSATVGSDLVVALDTILGGTIANATTYYLYIDSYTLSTAVTLTDTGEKVINVVQANLKLLTSTPDQVIPNRYAYVAWFRSANSGNSFSGTGSAFGSRPTKVVDELTSFFATPEEYTTTLTSASGSNVLTHNLDGEPQIVNFYYVDAGGNKNGVDPQNALITKSLTTLTVSTLGYDFSSGQSFIVEAFFIPKLQNRLASSSIMFVSQWFVNNSVTTIAHGLSDIDAIRSYAVQEWDVTNNLRRNLNLDALVKDFDGTNFYLDWTGLSPSSTLQYRIVTGGTALPSSVSTIAPSYTGLQNQSQMQAGFTVPSGVNAFWPGDLDLAGQILDIEGTLIVEGQVFDSVGGGDVTGAGTLRNLMPIAAGGGGAGVISTSFQDLTGMGVKRMAIAYPSPIPTPVSSGTTLSSGNGTNIFTLRPTTTVALTLDSSFKAGQVVKIVNALQNNVDPFAYMTVSCGTSICSFLGPEMVLSLICLQSNPTQASHWLAEVPLVSPWYTSGTSSFSQGFSAGFGTMLANSSFMRRIGDTMEVRGLGRTGTVSAAAAQMSPLPFSFSVDTNKIESSDQARLGDWTVLESSTTTIVTDTNNGQIMWNGIIEWATQTNTGGYVPVNVSAVLTNSTWFNWRYSVPIVGWTAARG